MADAGDRSTATTTPTGKAAGSEKAASGRRRGPGRPWAKGQSGNPKGRTPVLADIKQKFLANGNVEAVIKSLFVTAIEKRGTAVGVAASKEFLDRTVGKAPQPIVGEEGSPPINIDAPALVEELRRYVSGEED